MAPLFGVVVACGASGWTDVSPEPADGRGGRGGTSASTGGVPGIAGQGGTGAGGTGVGGAGGGGEEGGASGSGGAPTDAQPPVDEGPIVVPEDDGGSPPPPPPVDAGGNDVVPPGDGPSSPNLSAGLVGRWKLDEGTGTATVDSSGNGNDGVIKGAAWVPSGFPAKYPNPGALRFTDNDSVQLGTKAMPANNKPQTVAFWLNYTAIPGGDAQVCVALTDGKANGSRLKLGFKSQRLAAVKGGGTNNLVNTPPPAPGWHHFAYTYDGAMHRLFVDGQFKTMSTTAADTGAVTNVRLGGNFDNTEGFTGFLDEVRIYDHPLAAPEIAALAAGEQ